VLVVGVNDYQDARIPPLRFAEQDARSVYGFFTTSNRSPTSADRVQILLGKDASRVAVLKALRDHLARNAIHPDDMVVFYFAGHGFADSRDTYLASADTQLDSLGETGLSSATLRDYWSQIHAGRKVLITDACHSGALQNFRGIGGVSLALESPDSKAAPASTLTIAATGPNELSSEDRNLGQGVFTIALLNGLRGEADADGDGRVSGDELARFLQREVPAIAARANGKQTPVVEATGQPFCLTR
jgi:uncharacterized caspase-like protein